MTPRVSIELDSLFVDAGLGGTLYWARPGRHGRTWVRYDVRADGTLENERVIFGSPDPRSWRGLPQL
ncbi:MAG: hypothetical protein ACRENB_03080 [Gemmatimonadales bacterium]